MYIPILQLNPRQRHRVDQCKHLGGRILSATVPPPSVPLAVNLICPDHIFIDVVQRVRSCYYYTNLQAISDHALVSPPSVLMKGNVNFSNMAQSETALCRGCVMYLSNV
jgi:hypothetical protein